MAAPAVARARVLGGFSYRTLIHVAVRKTGDRLVSEASAGQCDGDARATVPRPPGTRTIEPPGVGRKHSKPNITLSKLDVTFAVGRSRSDGCVAEVVRGADLLAGQLVPISPYEVVSPKRRSTH